VLWKTSRYRATGSDVEPILPGDCHASSASSAVEDADSLTLRWEVRCAHGLVGQSIAIGGLGPAGIDALIRVMLADGRVVRGVVRANAPRFVVPAREALQTVARTYLAIGAQHVVSGLDHLLFLAALLLLARRTRAFVEAVAAFTVGHSLTLALATLGILPLPSQPIELAIALSVFAMAVELTRESAAPTLLRRRPWLIALPFGLLHGFGFADALRQIGLPAGEVPLALLSFNLGIELGALGVVAALLLLAAALRRLPRPLPVWAAQAPVYVIGTLAAYWCFERAFALIG
jgi:hydrogenase/urease accessory protein HupE